MATFTYPILHIPLPQKLDYDYLSGVGDGWISGDIKKKTPGGNIPAHCLVRLFRDQDGELIQGKFTDPVTGLYKFEFLSMDYTYTVEAYDHEKNFRAVISDGLIPSLGPDID